MYLKNSFYIENPYGRQVFKVYPCKTSASRNPSEPCLWAPLTFWYKLGKYDVKFIVQKNVQHKCVHSTSLPPLQKEEMVKSLSHTLLGLKSWATEAVQSNWLLVSRNTRPECPVKGKGEGLLLHLSVLSQDIKGRGGNGLHLDLLFWGGFYFMESWKNVWGTSSPYYRPESKLSYDFRFEPKPRSFSFTPYCTPNC